MTNDAPVPPPQGVLAYKMALAILSVLQEKGVLSEAEVERVLRAAKLSASNDMRAQEAASAPSAAAPLLDLDLS